MNEPPTENGPGKESQSDDTGAPSTVDPNKAVLESLLRSAANRAAQREIANVDHATTERVRDQIVAAELAYGGRLDGLRQKAARRSVKHETESVDAMQIARTRKQLLRRLQIGHRPGLVQKPWGMAMAAGVTGIVIGSFLRSPADLSPHPPGKGNLDLVLSVGPTPRGAVARSWTVQVADPALATSQAVKALIGDQIPFQVYRNSSSGDQHLTFSVPSVPSTELSSVLHQMNVPVGTSGRVHIIFSKVGAT